MIVRICFTLVLCWSTVVFGQTDSLVQIGVKDYHKAVITDIELHPSGAYFLSGDRSGKIVQTSTTDYDYVRTIAPSTGIPVKDIRIYNNGEALMVNSGFDLYAPNTSNIDSLKVYNLKDGNYLQGKALSIKMVGGVNKDVILIASQDSKHPGIFGNDNKSFKQLFSLDTKFQVQEAEVSSDRSLLFVATSNFIETFIQVYNVNSKKLLYEETLPKGSILSKIFIQDNHFGTVLFNKETNNVVVQKYDSSFSKSVLFKFPFEGTINVRTEVVSDAYFTLLVQPTSSFGSREVILISNKSGTIEASLKKLNTTAQTGVFMPSKNQYLFFKNVPSYKAGFVSYQVYDGNSLIPSAVFPKITFSRYNGFFLPHNDLLFTSLGDDKQDNNQSQIKYFEQGSFNNRFASLRYDDYFKNYKSQEVNTHSYYPEMMDLKTGDGIFISWRPDANNELSYLQYSFYKDTFNSFYTSNADDFYHHVEDFNSRNALILVGKNDYFDRGYNSPTPYRIIQPDGSRDLKGSYKHGTISDDGKCILTINENNVLEIHRINDLTIIHREQIENGLDFKLYPDPGSGFMVSVKNQKLDLEDCNTFSLELAIQNDSVTSSRHDCLYIEAVSAKNDETALIVEGVGVLFHEGVIPYNSADKPTSLSLNNDASKLLVSYEKGSIKVYNTSNLTLLATAYNPDKKSHLFYTPAGKYVTNTHADGLLRATKNGANVPLNQIPESYYDPVAVLETFGTLDEDYKTTLEASVVVRNENLDTSATNAGSFKEVQINGSKDQSIVNEDEISITIKLQQDKRDSQQFEVTRNGVAINDIAFSKIDSKVYKTRVAVVDSINVLEIRLKNKLGETIHTASKRVVYAGPSIELDLYIVAVGVSEYAQDRYNLTFADKDALDFVSTYKPLKAIDQQGYFTNFYGQRYTLINGNKPTKQLKLYDPSIYRKTQELTYIDWEAEHWLAPSEKGFNLWNFEEGAIKKASISTAFVYDPYDKEGNSLVYPSPEGNGFYYSTGTNTVTFYNFKTDQEKKIKLPFPISKDPKINKEFLLENNQWAYVELQEDTEDYETTHITQNIFRKENGTWAKQVLELDIKGLAVPEILASSTDGNQTLLRTIDGRLWIISKKVGALTSHLLEGHFKNPYGVEWFVDEETVTSVKDLYDEENKKVIEVNRFDYKGKNISSEQFSNFAGGLSGFGYNGEDVAYIKIKPPIANVTVALDTEKDKPTVRPISFKNIFANYLTNEQATDKAIKAALESLLKKANPQDEIIVFLAGHGVLDTELNYYYAPHNMDFENISAAGVSFETITEAMSQSKASKKLLLMDTCHAGNTLDLEGYEISSYERKKGERGAKVISSKNGSGKTPKVSEIVSTLFDNFLSKNGATIISASSGQDVAYENDALSNGAFTTAFLEQLKQKRSSYPLSNRTPKPVTLTDDLITEIRKKVLESTNSKQVIDVREVNPLAPIKIW